MVKIFSSSRYILNKPVIQAFADSYIQKRLRTDVNINLIFVGKRKMRSISRDYKHEDEALPILSFPFGDPSLLGEIFICFPQIVLLAAEREKTIDAILKVMIEHGINNLLQSS